MFTLRSSRVRDVHHQVNKPSYDDRRPWLYEQHDERLPVPHHLHHPPPPPLEPTEQTPNAYTKLVKSTGLPLGVLGVPKHVFKVQETTKLLLFISVAAGSVIFLDLCTKLLVTINNRKQSH